MSQSGVYTLGGGGGGSGITTLNGDTGSATGGTVTIAGDGVNISTAAGGSTVTISFDDNLKLPATTANLTEGTILMGDLVVFQCYGNDGFNNLNLFAGSGAGNGTLTVGTANDNVGLGGACLSSLTTGSSNVGVGAVCMSSVNTGSQNVAIGFGAGQNITTASSNVMIGYQAMQFNTGGTNNIAIGYSQAGGNWTTGGESDNIAIGSSGVVAEVNTIRIGTQGTGDGQQNSCFIAGIANATVNNSAAVLIDTTSGEMGTVVSSERFKDRITDMGDRSSRIMNLRPVNFAYKTDENHVMQWGLIAEEVAAIMPELVTFDILGVPYSVRYHDMPVILLNEIKKLVRRVEELEAKLNA
jgi:hypothetical protein